jgi:Flp pilus assembly CpaF family ATPase
MNSTTFDEKASGVWARILPFLRPIQALIEDPEISDIMVNGDRAVFIEKYGQLALAWIPTAI